mmetsp:Transcript_6718/g.16011  ORF Transcript_6718/g.16011 Transcript_6718/m.16011 type:complete len:676 (+) Transcript_6718:33-2060(+)
MRIIGIATLLLVGAEAFAPIRSASSRRFAPRMMSAPPSNKNVEQTLSTTREEVMTFSYDMSLEPEFEKPTYPGTGNGLGGEEGEYDVIVIGSGMGGLACGALNAKYGKKTLVLESHIKPGGSAHTFSRMHNGGKYSFEVGPSIFEGLDKPSLNPLRIIIDALGEEMPVKTYTGLGYWTPQGYWRFPVGSKQAFEDLLMEQAEDGPLAVEEWRALQKRLKTLGGSTLAVSLLNLRQDAGFLATTAGAAPYALTHPDVFTDLPLTFDSLHKTVDKIVTVPFLRNFIDTMCIFCGFPAKGAMTAHMLYILERFFEEGAAYSVPLGGTIEIANTLVRGLEKNGGKLTTNAHVDHIIVEDGRATGVVLKNGKKITAKQAVVSNATPFDTVKMLNLGKQELPEGVQVWKDSLGKLPRHGAILHLFLAIDATDLDLSHIDDPAHLIVQDWGRSLQDSQNLCSFFIPSLLDPSVCPEGKHVIHVYSSGGEPYEAWESMTPGSPEYEALKEERSQVLWQAVERCIPDVRERCEFSIVGSPLAHEAFLRRDRGTYGMAWAAGTSAPYAGLLKNILPFPFPNLKTPVDGLLRCGDSCFPGIGTPSAAASGAICANTMTPVADHIQMLRETAALHPDYKFMDPGFMANLYMPLVSSGTPSAELKVDLLGSPSPSVKTTGTPPTWDSK